MTHNLFDHIREIKFHGRFRKAKAILLNKSTGSIIANPNPIEAKGRACLGETTLFWKSSKTSNVEVRINSPDGPLFSQFHSSGSATTGRWIADGTVFFLQNRTGGLPLNHINTLDTIKVSVTPQANNLDISSFNLKSNLISEQDLRLLRKRPRYETTHIYLFNKPFYIAG